MLRITGIENLEKAIKDLEKLKTMGGKNIVGVVQNSIQPDGPEISENSTEALYEASYRGIARGEEENAEAARDAMSKAELDKETGAIVERFVRDLFRDIFSDLPQEKR